MRQRRALGVALAALTLSLPARAQTDAPPPPAGASAQVLQGAKLYQEHCLLCHGPTGQGGAGFPRPIWGKGHDLAKFANVKGLFEYMQMLMPFDNPAKIDDAAKTAIVSYMMVRNGTLKPGDTLPTGGNATPIR
jgi:mono/diheme cytochrome c family protein